LSLITDTGILKVAAKLGLSFENSVELNKIIDNKLPSKRPFKRVPFDLGGEIFEVYMRDIRECVKALFSDPKFAPYLKYSPERHYADNSHAIRLYHDMHTGDWCHQIYYFLGLGGMWTDRD
jgi:hypothetical protein